MDIPNVEAMEAFGDRIAGALSEGLVITLHGGLGAGKTTLVRGILQALGFTGAVKSPTYTLVELYQAGEHRICHFDLYRLAEPIELEEMGLRDYLDGTNVAFIEWPERGMGVLPEPDLAINIKFAGAGRQIDWQSNTAAGEQLAQNLL